VFHVILHEPQIPGNTGNVIRLCANSGCRLHLVRPIGFTLEESRVRRAGLDYHELARVTIHDSLENCLAAVGARALYCIETVGARAYSAARFRAGDALLFGKETSGLPPEVLAHGAVAERLAIPMRPGNRSLNLSNAVAIVVYEAWRQNGFRAED
jgi:tRNA (cytidine/uridine-2'-O-)-methyltransferase